MNTHRRWHDARYAWTMFSRMCTHNKFALNSRTNHWRARHYDHARLYAGALTWCMTACMTP